MIDSNLWLGSFFMTNILPNYQVRHFYPLAKLIQTFMLTAFEVFFIFKYFLMVKDTNTYSIINHNPDF